MSNISYELAKKLKDAGFPQKELEFTCQYCPAAFGKPDQPEVYIPTLSELIEACGDRFGKLIRRPNSPNYEGDSARWGALEVSGTGITIIREGWGYTPGAAVANLYLALHPEK